jgi:signal transduction histidine kinase
VDFLERLRRFLRHPVPVPDADHRYRQRFLAMLKRRDASGAPPDWVQRTLRMFGSRLNLFVSELSDALLAQGILPQEVPTLVDAGIALALEVDESPASGVHAMILHNAVARALEEVQLDYGTEHGDVYSGWGDVSRYAREIQAVRQQAEAAGITDIGRMLLELAGREAIKFLLYVEVALSTGVRDPWRINRETLQALATLEPAQSFNSLTFAFSSPSRALNFQGIQRMEALGLLEQVDEHSHRVLPHARPILVELAGDPDSPMSILVQALLEDEIRNLLPGKQAASATTVTIRQARLVVHELRNTVLPIQMALEHIDRTITLAGMAERTAVHRQRVEQGLERLLAVADEFDRLARASGETPEAFDAGSAAREAASIIAAEVGVAPELSLPESLPALLGVRTRFVLALVNLLRNAYQASPANEPRVALSIERIGNRVRCTVDDNGPGVPPEQREHVFLNGYSKRPGGSGHGLELVRSTIEKEMGGTLSYEEGSALGGARFVISVPIYERQP